MPRLNFSSIRSVHFCYVFRTAQEVIQMFSGRNPLFYDELFHWFTGSISVACVKVNGIGLKYVDHFQPFFKKDFINPQNPDELQPIGHLIKSLNTCLRLYPKLIRKDIAFEKYFSCGSVATVKGYTAIESKFHYKLSLHTNLQLQINFCNWFFFFYSIISHRIKY